MFRKAATLPDDRFLHKRAGHSDKFAMLTDFEWRVWCQYVMSSDDFGVMRLSALTLQEANDALARRSPDLLERCLRELVVVRLLNTFEVQRRPFLYQWDWQDWQKVKYPRRTLLPPPPLELCSRHTRWLLDFHPGGAELKSWKAPETWQPEVVSPEPVAALREDLANAREGVRELLDAPLAVSRVPLAVSRNEEQILRLSGARAKAQRPKDSPAENVPGGGTREFLDWWQTEYQKRREGAKYVVKWEVHGKLVKDLLRVHPLERLKKHAVILLTTDEDWTTGTDRGIGILSTKINWLEDRLTAWERRHPEKVAAAHG